MKQKEIWKPFPGAQERFLSCPAWEVLLHGNRGGGKSQPLWSNVLTPDGFKFMGDLSVGSEVICPIEKIPKNVCSIFPQGKVDVYRIITQYGDAYCSLDHLWMVKFTSDGQSGKYLLRRTHELIEFVNRGIKVYIPYIPSIPRCDYNTSDPFNFVNLRLSKILKIEKYKKDFCQCIKVDSINGLYITDNCLVTHNTDVLLMDYLQGVGQGYGIDYKGLILREATTELGDVITKSKKWIPQIFPTAKFNNQKKTWVFEGGETLWLNYARVEDDYWQYHGHSYSIKSHSLTQLANNTLVPAKDVKIGDYIQTLQGSRKVIKILTYTKPAFKVSVFDGDSNLIGSQLQGIIHPVLTNDGWQRIGLAYALQMPEQSAVGEHLVKEVSQFLHGVHQEIHVALCQCYTGNYFPISASISKWYSCLYQIVSQFLHSIIHSPSIPESRLYEILKNRQVGEEEKVLEIFCELWKHEHPKYLQLLWHGLFLITLLREIQTIHVRLLQSILFHSMDFHKLSLQAEELHQDVQQYLISREKDLLKVSEFDLLVQHQIVLNDISSCVRSLICKELNSLGCYFAGHDPNGGIPPQVLGIDRSFFQEQNDVPRHSDYLNLSHQGVKDNKYRYNHSLVSSLFYKHPYRYEFFQTKDLLLSLSFSISSFSESSSNTSLIDMVDFEVEQDNHYLTLLDSNIDIKNNQQIMLVNQNCFLGWEEITNHALPNLYLKLMSCSRTTNPRIKLKYRATCNPSGPGHSWVKERFIDKGPPEKIFYDEYGQARTHIQSNLLENKALLDSDPQYQAKLLAMTQDDKLLRDAWVFGSWNLTTGGFFTDVWNKKIHNLTPFKIPRSWTVFRSFDWGSSKPWCVTYGAESNGEQPRQIPGVKIPFFPRGSVIIIDEIYGWNGTADQGDRATSQEIAERVLDKDNALQIEYKTRVNPGPADTSIWEVRDGTSIAANMTTHRCRWTKAYKGAGSRISGWAMIRQMLGAAKRGDLETPHLYFFDQAVHHMRVLPVMQRDKRKPEDLDSSMEDHPMDSLRYLLTRKMMKMKRRKVGF